MTDPLKSYDIELSKRYDAECQELEQLSPAVIELSAYQALAIVTHVQFSAADPAVKYNPLLQSAIAAAKHIQESFNRESAIYEVLELCWGEPETDEVPPYFPDNQDHF
jgi:hypothetical protein